MTRRCLQRVLHLWVLGVLGLTPWSVHIAAASEDGPRMGGNPIERDIETRLNAVLKLIEPDARAIVEAVPKRRALPLPGTRASFDVPLMKDDSGKVELTSLTVTVFTVNELPPSAREELLRVARAYHEPVEYRVRRIVRAARPAEGSTAGDAPRAETPTQAPKDERDERSQMGLMDGETFRSALSELGGDARQAGQAVASSIQTQSILLIVAMVALGLLVFLSLRRLGANPTASGAVTQSESSGATPSRSPAPRLDAIGGGALTPASQGSGLQLDGVTVDHLRALFSDLYWCGEDHYAAFVWKQLPAGLRSGVVEGMPMGRHYLKWIDSLEPVDRGYFDDATYMDPPPVDHLSQIDLAEMVRQNGALYFALSRIRQDTLPIALTERLELLSRASESQPVIQEGLRRSLQERAPSVQRNLPERLRMKTLSNEDEKALLAGDAPDVQLLGSVRTLIWGWWVGDEAGQGVLAEFSAAELAEGLAGPFELIEKLVGLLPDKKRDLVLSYQKQRSSSKSSAVFEDLAEAFRERYRARALNPSEDSSHDDSDRLSTVA